MRPDTLSENGDAWFVLKLPPVTLHAWRSIDILTICRRLGHGSHLIPLSVYGHLFPGNDQRAAEQIDNMFASVLKD